MLNRKLVGLFTACTSFILSLQKQINIPLKLTCAVKHAESIITLPGNAKCKSIPGTTVSSFVLIKVIKDGDTFVILPKISLEDSGV